VYSAVERFLLVIKLPSSNISRI